MRACGGPPGGAESEGRTVTDEGTGFAAYEVAACSLRLWNES